MKKNNLYAGCSIDEAYYELHKCQEPCYTILKVPDSIHKCKHCDVNLN